jgi:hypothetical protein
VVDVDKYRWKVLGRTSASPHCESALLYCLFRPGYVLSGWSPALCRLNLGQVAVGIAGVQINRVPSGASSVFVDREGARLGTFGPQMVSRTRARVDSNGRLRIRAGASVTPEAQRL